jgi:hypothetical protein
VCWFMVILCPLALAAADGGAAVLHSKGGVWVNGAEVPDSTAISPGDHLETKPGFIANLDAEGSSILIQPESIATFQGTFLVLEHGSVSVGTSTAMSVHVNCIRVVPVSRERTQYDVGDLNGTVQVAAHKNDVNITQGGTRKSASDNNSSQSASVHEGQQASRDESSVCGAALRPGVAGHALNTKWIEIGGGAGVGGLILCLLLCGNEKPMSPSEP